MFLPVIKSQVAVLRDLARARKMMRYFKTGPGEYGEGDTFVGLTSPECRRIAATNKNASFTEVEELLGSEVHEERFIGLVILTHKLKQTDKQDDVYQLYLRNLKAVNNWDLVDISAPHIMGTYIFKRCQSYKGLTGPQDPRSILYQLVSSKSLWERRISIMSTFTFIKHGEYFDSLHLASQLLKDKEDLIHKAVGWMLRQVGKRQLSMLQNFLQDYYKEIPRTTLRYAIQKMQESKRQDYLLGKW